MIGNAEQDALIRELRWAVVTTLRKDGTPSNSVIFYAVDGDELIFSTTKDRVKAKTLKRDPRVAVTVLDEGAPHRFVTIEGAASVVEDDIVPGHVLINRAMRKEPDWEAPEGYVAGLASAGRVLIRVKAERVSGVVRRG